MVSPIVTGRFAPSPTGDLHLGSLVAATASYLNVKQQQGRWLLRIDDIDTPRVVSGSQDRICRQLEAYGFEWDKLTIQSQRLAHYEAALAELAQQGVLYECDCTRKQFQQRLGKSGCYDNFCRHRQLKNCIHSSIRIKTPDIPWHYQDAIQGEQVFDWPSQSGDFIVKRADGIFAYHLVAAVDDSDEGITEVIRGADLIGSTAPQQYLQQCLKGPSPLYGHHPIIIDSQSKIKLSKASQAPALKPEDAVRNLFDVLTFLNQQPPNELKKGELTELWHWAKINWSLQKINPSLSRD
ncbi:MAG: tRNA glutamyl-Q(34) synthetase GluQRS [Gammaproteobacteria bacterium]|nr:tRNA glutamyl-Q(34) synthetase GluQRS [Gammaproteobacteria bacterium]